MEESNEENLSNQYCGFKVGSGHYAIPVLSVQEVVKPQAITSVPLSQKHVKGLINLRGQIVTSVCMKSLIGLDKANIDDDHMNIIVRGSDSLIALAVDEIMDVFNIEEYQVEETPDTIDEGLKEYVNKVYKQDGDLIILLDVEKLIDF